MASHPSRKPRKLLHRRPSQASSYFAASRRPSYTSPATGARKHWRDGDEQTRIPGAQKVLTRGDDRQLVEKRPEVAKPTVSDPTSSQSNQDPPREVAARFFESWNLDKAHEWYEKALKQLQDHKQAGIPTGADKVAIADCELSLSMVLLRQGHFESARQMLIKLKAEVEAIGASNLKLPILLGQAQLCSSVKDFLEVALCLESHIENASRPADQLKKNEEYLAARDTLASLYLAFGRLDEAVERVEQNLLSWEKLLDARTADWIEEITRVFDNADETARASFRQRTSEMKAFQKKKQFDEARRIRRGFTPENRHWLEEGKQTHEESRGNQMHEQKGKSQESGETEHDLVGTTNSQFWGDIGNSEKQLRRVEGQILDCSVLRARVHLEMGHYETALGINETTLHGMRAVWGPRHVVTLRSIHLEAEIQLLGGKLKESGMRCMHALGHMRDQLGWDHYMVIEVLDTLVQLYCAEARWADAEELATYVVEQQNKERPSSHPQTIRSRGNLTEVQDLLGKSGKAKTSQTGILEECQTSLGPSHPVTVLNMARLATINFNVSSFRETGTLLREFTNITESNDKSNQKHKSITYADAKRRFGIVARRYSVRLRDEGNTHAEELMDISSKFLHEAVQLSPLLPPGSSRIISAKFEQVLTRRDASEPLIPEDTLPELQDLFRALSGELGPTHPQVLATGHEISVTLCAMEQWEEAKENATEVFETRLETLGDIHRDVLQSQTLLAKICLSLRQLTAAESLLLGLERKESKISSAGQQFDFSDVYSTLAFVLSERAQEEVMVEKQFQKDSKREEPDCDVRKRAVELQEKVLKIRQRHSNLSDYPKRVLEAEHDLATVYQKVGKMTDALDTLNKLVSKLHTMCAEEPRRKDGSKRTQPFLFAVQSDMAALYWAIEKLDEAEKIQKELLSEHEKLYGGQHPDTVICRYNLALTLRKMGTKKKSQL